MLKQILKIFKLRGGQSMIELVIAVMLFALLGAGVVLLTLDALSSTKAGEESTIASYLVHEGIDAAKSIRDNRWLDLTNGDHGLQNTSGYWDFSGSQEVIDGKYTRKIIVSSVNRDLGGDIVVSGGQLDSRTKLVTSQVSWTNLALVTRTISADSYLVDWNVFDWLETTDTEFGAGSLNSVEVSGSGDNARLQLAASGVVIGPPEWQIGSGQTFTDTTNSDFSAGTNNNTQVLGAGFDGYVTLDSEPSWDLFNFPFGKADMNATSANWAVGEGGGIFNWTGSQWVQVDSPTTNDLLGLWEVSGSEVYAVGAGGVLLRYTGTNWQLLSSVTTNDLNSVSMISSADGFVVGEGGIILRWDGADWNTITSPTTRDLNGVFMNAASDGWAVGANGTILYWDGASWAAATSPTTKQLNGVWMLSTTEGYIAGDSNTILQWDGASWTTMFTPPPSRGLNSISMISSVDGFAVGNVGQLLRWDGVDWTHFSSPTNKDLYGVYMISASDGWMLGRDGGVFRWNGSSWQTFTQTTSQRFNDVDLVSAIFGFIVGESLGDGIIKQWDGNTWTLITSPVNKALKAVDMVSSTDGWAVGSSSAIIQWDGNSWSEVTAPASATLNDVSMISSTNGFIVGAGKTIFQWDGVSWATVPGGTGPNRAYNSVSMISASDGFIVGGQGTTVRWNGTSWSNVNYSGSENLYSVQMLSASDAWAVGAGGSIIHWDGASWSSVTSPTANDLNSVKMLSATEGYAIGDNGEIVRWDGISWSIFASPTSQNLQGLALASSSEGWAVGANGAIIRLGDYFFTSGTFLSRVFFGGDSSTTWDLLTWTENNFSITDLTIATRTGDTPTPDGSWSAFSSELTDPEGSIVTSGNAKYFQYRITFTTSEITLAPDLLDITIVYNDVGIVQHLYDSSMLSDTDGWAVGANGTIIHWNNIEWLTVSSPTVNHLFGIDMVASNDGWLVGDGGAVARYNGAIWTNLSFPTSSRLNSVDMVASNDGWAVGDGGVIIQWNGVSWSTVTSPTTNDLNKVYMVASNDGWAVGDGGVIIQWNGVSWSTVTSPVTDDLYSVFMFTSSDGWAVGDSGKILQYSGISWSEFSDAGSIILRDVFMITATDGRIVGDNGKLLIYDNTTSAWLLDFLPTIFNVYSVEFTSATEGWAMGQNGTLIHYTPVDSGGGSVIPGEFVDDTQGEFDAGSYSDTQFDGTNNWVELDSTGQTNGSGTFTSDIKDAGTSATWTDIAWTPQAPYGKELPDNGSVEIDYPQGNADMTSNVLLMHMNEASGIINDTSGQNNNGIASGGVTYGAAGKLNTALQFDGIDDKVTILDAASLDITDTITVEAWLEHLGGGGASLGAIVDTPVDSLEFDTANGSTPSIVAVSGDVYAIAYKGAGNDGFVTTVEIATNGQITNAAIDTLEFDTGSGVTPDIIHVSGDIYAIAYTGGGSDGFIATVEIASNGQITNTVVDTLEFDTANGDTPDIINVSGDIYAIAYEGAGSDGFVATVDIAANGQIANTVVDTFEFDTGSGVTPDIVHVSGNVFAVAYTGAGSDGFLASIEIAANGAITAAVIDTLEFDTGNGDTPDIINISGDFYAIVYEGSGSDGFLTTVEIAANGSITNAVVDTFEFDPGTGTTPAIISVSGDIYSIAYTGPGSDGFISTVEISTSGLITASVIDTLEFNTADGNEPSIVAITGSIYAIAYAGPAVDGFITTIEIESAGGASQGGIIKSGAYALEVDTGNAYATINSQTISASLSTGLNHIVLTYDKNAGSNQQILYINGSQAATGTLTAAVSSNANDLIIAEFMNALIDEVAIYNGILSPAEVLDHYKRGALRLKFQVRSCDDGGCSGESFIGPDGTGSDYYDEPDNNTIDLPDFALTNVINNRYFQYQATFETDDSLYTPELTDVTISYLVAGGGGGGGFSSPGTFLSGVVNSDGTSSTWETLYWEEALPASTDAAIAVRSGNTATPDGSWSAFTADFTDPNGNLINLTGQYLQYRVTLTTSDPNFTPTIDEVLVTYKP